VDFDGNPIGDVHLWASNGSIRDYLFAEELNEDTFNELLALADEVGLRGLRKTGQIQMWRHLRQARRPNIILTGATATSRESRSALRKGSFSFNKTQNTITRSSGTWADDGFTDKHQTIYVSGSGIGNDGKYEVHHIDGSTIWLKAETPLAADETDLAAGSKIMGEIPHPWSPSN
jgi:hypothetical protein